MSVSMISKDSVSSTKMTHNESSKKLITLSHPAFLVQFCLSFAVVPYKSHLTFLGLNFFMYKIRHLKSDSEIWMQNSKWGILQPPEILIYS